jgi:hypothetical protein
VTFQGLSMERIVIERSNMSTIASFTHTVNVVRPTTKTSSGCKICGAPARYSYFGSIACESCKMFFKRNAEYEQVN